MRYLALILSLLVLPSAAMADERLVRLSAAQALIDTGVLKYALPRFSLKTQVRVDLVPETGDPQIVLGDAGRPLLQQGDRLWSVAVMDPEHPGTARLADWLTGEIGQNTLTAYAPEGTPLFTAPQVQDRAVASLEMDGDAALGHAVALAQCTRCHAVDKNTRGSGIGSTPSFAVLRSLDDWQDRFEVFYVLNPHPAFTIVTDVTPPFDESRPSPIVPIEVSLDEVEHLLAYVADLAPADLGAPLAHQ